jgi:hypothetical protein
MGLHLSIPVFPGVRYTTTPRRRSRRPVRKPELPELVTITVVTGLIGTVFAGVAFSDGYTETGVVVLVAWMVVILVQWEKNSRT